MPRKQKDEMEDTMTDIIYLPQYFYKPDYKGQKDKQVAWDITADACIPLFHQMKQKDKDLKLRLDTVYADDKQTVINACVGDFEAIGAASIREFPPKGEKPDRRAFFVPQIAATRAIKTVIKFALNLSDLAITELIKQYDEAGLLPQTATGKFKGVTSEPEPEPPAMAIVEDDASAFDDLLEG